MKKKYYAGISATGMVLPKHCYTNDDIIAKINAATLDRDDVPELNAKWIEDNIWIKTRYHFGEEEYFIDVSAQAIEQALEQAGWSAKDLDFVILSSMSTHCEKDSSSIPSAGCLVQEKIGADNAFAYNMSAACSGWVYAMSQAVAYIESGMAVKGAVVCTEKSAQGLDFTDHRSSVLIGDVAVATLVERTETPKMGDISLLANRGENLSHIIRLPYYHYNGDELLGVGAFELQGRQVFKKGIATMYQLTLDVLKSHEVGIDDVDWFIYHQANGAMLRKIGQKVGMADEKNLMNIQKLANTTAGTIPSVLHMYIEDGTIKRGDKVCCIAFGGGLTAGSLMFEY